MKTITVYVLIIVFALDAFAKPERNAGIVLYFESGNDVYLLLADHAKKSKRGWSSFGGRAEKGETPAETAARETEEETKGFFRRQDLLEKILHTSPVIDDNGFALFFLKINFVPAQQLTNHTPAVDNKAFKERGPYAWIPLSDIEKYIENDIEKRRVYPIDERFLPASHSTHWYWWKSLRNLRKAKQLNAFPWN